MINPDDLRALVVLKTCVQFVERVKRPPCQIDLFWRIRAQRDPSGKRVAAGYGEGSIIDQWNALEGIEREYPYALNHLRQIYKALTTLRALGLMYVPPSELQGRQREGQAFLPTSKGRALVAALPQDWREWRLPDPQKDGSRG